MGIDAPSTDLTARIRAKRAALIAAGEVDPARPGEHVQHGTNLGALDALERVAAAAEARERRGRPSGEVVPEGKVYEMEYLDGELGTIGDEPTEFISDDEDEADLLSEDEPESAPGLSEDELLVLAERQYAEGAITASTDAPMRLAVIEEQLEGVSKALVMIASSVGALPEEVVRAVASLLATPAPEPRPPVGMIRRFFRWLW